VSPPVIIRPAFPNFPRLELAKNPTTAYAKPKVGGAPVVFSAQATLAVGKSGVLNAQTLQSGFRTSYFIDEIRVSMHTTKMATTATARGFTGLSNLVKILFQTGKYQFSADAVPAGLLAPMFGQDYGNVDLGAIGEFRSFSSIRWMLPKPLFMPAGDVVLANVSIDDLTLLTTIFGSEPCVTVTITYVGRLLPQGYIAQSREVPWLAWWTKNASTVYADSTTRLRNPFKIPAHVQRFTQRTYDSKYGGALTEYYSEESARGQLFNTGVYETVKISDSRGYSITNKFVPVGDVFDVARHAWTFGRELSPREQFNMQMTTENPASLPANHEYITNIGLVGYRSEAP
jgi:hypothetical protein